ncbi:MAG: leucine-rich repeat protein [Lachnospiraceae bacterium]|nr:leucine-rich repeat protein [Lachnospiraceae bacterium]
MVKNKNISRKIAGRMLATGLSAMMLVLQAQIPVMADVTEQETVFEEEAFEESLSAEQLDEISVDVESALQNMKQVRAAAEKADREVPAASVKLPENDAFGEHIDLSPEGIEKMEMTEEEYLAMLCEEKGISYADESVGAETSVSGDGIAQDGPDISGLTASEAIDVILEEELSAESATKCMTTTQAADLARKEMKKRKSVFYLEFKPSADTSQINIVNIINQVFEEGIGRAEDEGDYLFWSVRNLKYTAQRNRYTGAKRFVVYAWYYDTTAQEKYVKSYLDLLFPQLGINSAAVSDQEKIRKCYEFITSNISYDTTHAGMTGEQYPLQYTAYAGLHDKTCVCQGYALLFYRMMKRAGITARLMPGYGQEERHGWNIVQLGGKFYNVDSTWDSTVLQEYNARYQFFLKNEAEFPNHTRDAKYNDAAFHSKYPMAAVSYPIYYWKATNGADNLLHAVTYHASASEKFALRVSRVDNNTASLQWDAVNGAVRYDVYGTDNGDFVWYGSYTTNAAAIDYKVTGGNMTWYVTASNAERYELGKSNNASCSAAIMYPKKGTKFTDVNSATYKVTKAGNKGCEVAVVKWKKNAARVTIPDVVEYNGIRFKVTSIGAGAFKNQKKLKAVTMGANIKSIGKSAFFKCKKLSTVEIRSTNLKKVGKKAFAKTAKKIKLVCKGKKKKAYKSKLTKAGAKSVKAV